MKGKIKNLIANRNYGFINSENHNLSKDEFFFHREDFNGHWDDLVSDYNLTGPNSIEVNFEVVESPKGPRAADVRRIGHPNEAS